MLKAVQGRGIFWGIVLLAGASAVQAQSQIKVSAAEARAIAKEAYIYGEPIVDNYRIQHAYWVDKSNPEYKGPYNQLWNSARLFSPADVAIQTPNSHPREVHLCVEFSQDAVWHALSLTVKEHGGIESENAVCLKKEIARKFQPVCKF